MGENRLGRTRRRKKYGVRKGKGGKGEKDGFPWEGPAIRVYSKEFHNEVRSNCERWRCCCSEVASSRQLQLHFNDSPVQDQFQAL